MWNVRTVLDGARDFQQREIQRAKKTYRAELAACGVPRSVRRQMSKDGWTRAWIVYADLSHWGMI